VATAIVSDGPALVYPLPIMRGGTVESIADALVYAVAYINCRPLEDAAARYDDGDVGALESIAGFLHSATVTEQNALAAAAERALSAEQSSPQPRPEFVRDYERWMEDMFGDGWRGNRRVSLGD
jgi:hypothetical protein